MLWWQFCTTTVLALCDTGRTKSSAGPRDAANSCVAACQFCEENLGRSVAPLPTARPRLRPTGRPRPNYTIRVQTQSGTTCTSGSNKSPTGSRPVRPVRRRGWMMRGWRRRRRRRRGPAAVTTAGRRPAGWRRGRRRGRRCPGGGGGVVTVGVAAARAAVHTRFLSIPVGKESTKKASEGTLERT